MNHLNFFPSTAGDDIALRISRKSRNVRFPATIEAKADISNLSMHALAQLEARKATIPRPETEYYYFGQRRS